MANHIAVAAVGRAIVNLLKDSSRFEFPRAEFKLLQATDFASNRHPREGASVYLYQVEVNTALHNLPARPDPIEQYTHPPIPLNLRFLITPWAGDPEKQYRLLGWIIHVLDDTPILSAALLNKIAPNVVVFSPEETVTLVFDPLSLADLSIIFQSLKQPGVLPSATYSAALELGEFLSG